MIINATLTGGDDRTSVLSDNSENYGRFSSGKISFRASSISVGDHISRHMRWKIHKGPIVIWARGGLVAPSVRSFRFRAK